MINKKKIENHRRLKKHIRLRVTGTSERPRLTVFRSLKHMYAQIVDDSTGKTLLSISDVSKEVKSEIGNVKGQVMLGKKIGTLTAKRALEKKITQVVFDRNGYLYHGAVKALADGAREGGLKF
jgi:large subunit ribosomal protein L18